MCLCPFVLVHTGEQCVINVSVACLGAVRPSRAVCRYRHIVFVTLQPSGRGKHNFRRYTYLLFVLSSSPVSTGQTKSQQGARSPEYSHCINTTSEKMKSCIPALLTLLFSRIGSFYKSEAFVFTPTSRRGGVVVGHERLHADGPSPFLLLSQSIENDMDEATVQEISGPYDDNNKNNNASRVTLVGTAHLSQASNEQVERIIATVRPDVVAIELDESRLPRIGFSSIEDIPGIAQVVAIGSTITIDDDDDDLPVWQYPQRAVREAVSVIVGQVARTFLSNMYETASDRLQSRAGGEFVAAVDACQRQGVPRLVLADRTSTTTIQRAVRLALESGDIGEVLYRLDQVNREEMQAFQTRVMEDMTEDDRNDETNLTRTMMETLKSDTTFRTRLFERLEREVPEFTTAFIQERDYIMAEAIRREVMENGARHVVGVVGLAHVAGMKRNLQDMFSQR